MRGGSEIYATLRRVWPALAFAQAWGVRCCTCQLVADGNRVKMSRRYEAENPEPRMRLNAIFPNAQVHFGFFNDGFNAFSGDFAPQRTAVQEILRFTAALGKGDYLLVHCAVGVSRSTAITFATLCHHAGSGYEADCFRALKRIRPSASPNPLIVEYADELLGRNGMMTEAIKGETGNVK